VAVYGSGSAGEAGAVVSTCEGIICSAPPRLTYTHALQRMCAVVAAANEGQTGSPAPPPPLTVWTSM
jgi:hypothetical protein